MSGERGIPRPEALACRQYIATETLHELIREWRLHRHQMAFSEGACAGFSHAADDLEEIITAKRDERLDGPLDKKKGGVIRFVNPPRRHREAPELPNLREHLAELLDDDLLLADGFDNCLIGLCYTPGPGTRAVYDAEAIIRTLVEREGLSFEEAHEYFSVNIEGSYVGEKTPIFMTRLTEEPLLQAMLEE
jgi:hypothetical protein